MNKIARDSTQKRLERVRAPRVHLTYDVEVHGVTEQRELPFEVAILADLSGHAGQPPKPLREREFVNIDLDNFDNVLERYAPRLVLEVPNRLSGQNLNLTVELRFRCLSDFEPESIVNQIEPLRNLLTERSLLVSQITSADRNDRIDECEESSLSARRDEIDAHLSAQVNEIMHSAAFQRLEATWRGLQFLVCRTETSSMLRLRVLDVSKKELVRDLQSSINFDQSALFKHVYEGEYGTFGQGAIGLLIGDYEIGREPEDMYLLEQISLVAAAAHAPFVAAAGPTLFGFDSFGELAYPRDLSRIFDKVEYAHWRSFRESEDARYVGLALPHILLRRPHSDFHPVEAFNFQERCDEHDDFLWGNPAFALGTCITNAFVKYHWCAAIKGIEGGGLIEGLPTATFMTEYGEVATKCPVEIALSDRREVELAHLGFMPVLHVKNTDFAAFFSMQTCRKPPSYDNAATDANARLATQLQYVLTTSRFAHYFKCIIRDRLGSFMSRANCENFLNQWVSQYVTSKDGLSLADKVKFPLREARVNVTEVPGKPGVYQAIAFLRPHFLLDDLSISMRIVVELPIPATH